MLTRLSTNKKNIYSISIYMIIEHFLLQFPKETQHSGNNNNDNNNNSYNNKKLQMYLYVVKKKQDVDKVITTSICYLLYPQLSCYA